VRRDLSSQLRHFPLERCVPARIFFGVGDYLVAQLSLLQQQRYGDKRRDDGRNCKQHEQQLDHSHRVSSEYLVCGSLW
jgi:hypothetical protein